MGYLEWFNRSPYYPYIANNLSTKQLSKIKYIYSALDNRNLIVFGHMLFNNGFIAGIDMYDSFYVRYNEGYEPCGIEIVAFKWINNLGISVESFVDEIICAIDIYGNVTQLGRFWINSAMLPHAKELCFAKIDETIEDGFRIKKVTKGKKLGVLVMGSYKLILNAVLYGSFENYAYITYCADDDMLALRLSLFVDKNNNIYFNYNNDIIYLNEFKGV